MARHHFRLALDDLRKHVLDRICNARVEVSAPVPQQGAVSGILQQAVLEQKARLRRLAALEDQAGLDQPTKRLLDLPLRPLGDPGRELVGKLSANCRADLRNLLGPGADAVKPCHQGGMQGRWDRERGARR